MGIGTVIGSRTRAPSRHTRRVRALVGVAVGCWGGAVTLAVMAPEGPPAHYERGSAALALGRWEEAAEAFEMIAAFGPTPGDRIDPELRYRALHNLALARLMEASATDAPLDGRPALARASVEAGREALRMQPEAEGTRLNLQIADRLLASTRGADGASAVSGPPAPAGTSPPGSPSRPGASTLAGGEARQGASGFGGGAQALTTGQAEAILDGVESLEAPKARAEAVEQMEGLVDRAGGRGAGW